MTAEDILRRLLDAVERSWDEDNEHMKREDEDAWLACRDARAYLSREKGPVAERAVFFVNDGGAWMFGTCDEREPDAVMVRIPVPAHIVSPPVIEGEVVEGS